MLVHLHFDEEKAPADGVGKSKDVFLELDSTFNLARMDKVDELVNSILNEVAELMDFFEQCGTLEWHDKIDRALDIVLVGRPAWRSGVMTYLTCVR